MVNDERKIEKQFHNILYFNLSFFESTVFYYKLLNTTNLLIRNCKEGRKISNETKRNLPAPVSMPKHQKQLWHPVCFVSRGKWFEIAWTFLPDQERNTCITAIAMISLIHDTLTHRHMFHRLIIYYSNERLLH